MDTGQYLTHIDADKLLDSFEIFLQLYFILKIQREFLQRDCYRQWVEKVLTPFNVHTCFEHVKYNLPD